MIVRDMIIKIIAILIFLFGAVNLAKDKNIKTYSIGFDQSLIVDVNPNDATAALDAWIKTILKHSSAGYNLRAKLFDNFEDLSNNYVSDTLAMIVISSYDYLNSSFKNKFKPIFAPGVEGETGISYLIITRKEKKLNNLSELKNLSLGYNILNQDIFSSLWLDILLNKNKLPAKEKFFSKVEGNTKDSRLILDVFFRKLDVCLVAKHSYELMVELNPQIKDKLKIMYSSHVYTHGLLCFTNVLNDESSANDLMKTISDMEKYQEGKQMLKLLKINDIVPFKPEFLNSVKELLNEHQKINIINDSKSN